ncbi:MAG: SusF/SusE family outer membrane protein [Ginsengibacter sp.]
MTHIKIINFRRFYNIKSIALFFSMVALVSLCFTSCKKEIKAGDPITLTYDHVYMVGNATSVGWSINDAIPMTQTPGKADEFTWEGPLFAGEIKFPTALSWSSDTFMSATPGQAISDDKALLALSGNPDYHWVITDAEAGNYKITLNTKESTVIFQKQ